MAALGRVDSISDPWEILIGSIWSYKCDASYVRLTSQSGIAADAPTLRTNQVLVCLESRAHVCSFNLIFPFIACTG